MASLLAELLKTAPLIYNTTSFRDKLNRAKYVARGLAFAGATREWFNLLAQPKIWALAKHDPFAHSKLQRPYLQHRARTSDRLRALENHYAFACSVLSPRTFDALAQKAALQLATIPVDDTEQLGLHLRAGAYTKEGEFVVSLRSQSTREWICSLSFTVTIHAAESRQITIGGMQGHTFNDDKARIIAMTRGMRGMRPKALVLFCLQQLANSWGVRNLRAVSNDLHIYRSLQRRKALHADYDSFWEESGGQPQPDGFFQLPIVPPVRDIAEIKPNKRSMYRQRYALLDSLAAEIRQSIDHPALTHPA